MNSKKWLISGMYFSAILIGWALAFGGTQYAYRLLTLDELNNIQAPSISEKDQSISTPKSNTPLKNSYTSVISRRNIFDSTQAQKPAQKPLNSKEENMTISDIDAALMGTIVMKPDTASLAMIQLNSNKTITPYGIGDQLLDAKIEVIEPEYVWIRRNNQLEVLRLFGEKAQAGTTSKKNTNKSDDDSGVSKSGKDKYTVDQEIFDELLQNPEKLYTQIRATEHKKDGEVDGYRVSGIRRKSIFYKLGIKNGDVIHNVNGMPLTNLNEAMKAFESLQSSRDFNFNVTRRRKKRTMEYEVR
ncbi:MAG: hypothetical protein CL916_02225 [Deltaproteobacteria bacterium]|nr:hypothetical protein [Deltaproteobacteria bacterium]